MAAQVQQVASDDISTWIIGDDEEAVVIDPGPDPDRVLDAVGEREVLAVICTHGYPGCAPSALAVAWRDEVPVALHPRDRTGWQNEPPEIEMADGGIFEVADVRLEVIHTPGFSAGSVCLYCEDLEVVFTGQAMTASGPAQVDGAFPDFAGQLNAIGEFLLTLPSQTRVLPAQGPETTIGMAEKSFDTWVSAGP
jgi:glyoxylase-like metal-dependent hydrolase (beta-lactamase superfamily II)